MSIIKLPYFKQYLCLITIFGEKKYHHKMQLDSNARLTLAQT